MSQKKKPKGASKMEITYKMQGDYQIPNLSLPDSPKIGKYGMMRKTYLMSHRKGIYTGMKLSGTLNSHLEEIDQQASQMVEEIISQMAQSEQVNEQLKQENQMLWVQKMNSFQATAEEIVLNRLIYS